MQASFSLQEVEIEVTRDEVWLDFPESADFRLQATAISPIVSAKLIFGVTAQTCTPITQVAEMNFESTTELDITWRWEIIENQLIPPGSEIWWQWQLETEDGEPLMTERQTAVYLDSWFVWQSISEENLTVHWYRGPNNIGEEMLAAGLSAIEQLAIDTGLRLTEPIDLYLYDEPFDLRISVPGAPAWVGGAAFPEKSIVLAVANKDYLDYGADTVKHEIGHVVIGRLTFNCVTRLPTWLNEGLAMVAEGRVDEHSITAVSEAAINNAIIPLAQLEGSFSIHSDRARLSYAQSYSLTSYLIESYGQANLLALLEQVQQGNTLESTLVSVYGFDIDEFEADWREDIGAIPLMITESDDADVPTVVPTIALLGVTAISPTEMPSSTATPTVVSTQTVAPTQSPSPTIQATETLPTSEPTLAPSPTPKIVETPSNNNNTMWYVGGIISLVISVLLAGLFLKKR